MFGGKELSNLCLTLSAPQGVPTVLISSPVIPSPGGSYFHSQVHCSSPCPMKHSGLLSSSVVLMFNLKLLGDLGVMDDLGVRTKLAFKECGLCLNVVEGMD